MTLESAQAEIATEVKRLNGIIISKEIKGVRLDYYSGMIMSIGPWHLSGSAIQSRFFPTAREAEDYIRHLGVGVSARNPTPNQLAQTLGIEPMELMV